jgi:hypothetical protein
MRFYYCRPFLFPLGWSAGPASKSPPDQASGPITAAKGRFKMSELVRTDATGLVAGSLMAFATFGAIVLVTLAL